MNTEPTRRPWKFVKARTVIHVFAERPICSISTTGYKGMTPAERTEYAERAAANAAHIVRCVNAHDGLVKALEEAELALVTITEYPVPEQDNAPAINMRSVAKRGLRHCQAALAQAKAGA